MKLVVSAGGRGTRLKLFSPKSLLLIRDKPLIYYHLRAFEDTPISDVHLAVDNTETIDKLKMHFEELSTDFNFNFSFGVYPYSKPITAFRNEETWKFINGDSFIWTHSDDIFSRDLIVRMLEKHEHTQSSVATRFRRKRKAGISYIFESCRVVAIEETDNVLWLVKNPILISGKDSWILKDAVKRDYPLFTDFARTIIANSSLYFVNPDQFINLNYKKDIARLEKRIELEG